MRMDFTYPQGTDYTLNVTVKDSAGVTTDLTGYTVRGQARPSYDGSLSFQFVCTLLSQITNTGQFAAAIPKTAITSVLSDQQSLVYDIEIESSSGTVTRVLEGVITVTPEVTR